MKKILLLSVTIIILFCIVPISKTQAMLGEQKQDTIVSEHPVALLHAFNQNKFFDAGISPDNLECRSSAASLNVSHDRLIARGGGAGAGGTGGSGAGSGSGTSVSRSGHGRSRSGENYDANSHRKKDIKEEEEGWPEKENWPEEEWPKDDWGDAEYPED